jgi:hypothetical protein
VEISLPKTHVSKDTYEFAKRWLKFNEDGSFLELTGLPMKGLIRNYKEPKIIYSIILDFVLTKQNTLIVGNLANVVLKIFGR